MKHLLSMISRNCRSTSLGLSRFVLTTALITLCSCSSASPTLTVHSVGLDLDQPPEKAPLPKPVKIKTLPVHWKVIILNSQPYYCMTPKSYQNLSLTNADTVRWITESKWLNSYYTQGLKP